MEKPWYSVIVASKSSQPNIFKYTNYRKYLKDWYASAKQKRGGFSYRSFSKKAGFTSSNIFKLVMDGDRNLSLDGLKKFCIGLKLNQQESDFFKNLVLYNQAKNLEEKNNFYQNLLRSKKLKQLKPILKDQYDYYSQWYNTVIRELVTSEDYPDDIEWISQKLNPTVPPEKVEASIKLLENLKLIQKENGKYKQTTSLLSSGDESSALETLNFHQNLLALMSEQLTNVDQNKRDVSALVLGISQENFNLIKKRIQKFRKEILKIASSEQKIEVVALLGMQWMPVTKNDEQESD